jgi:hypothetical protein
MLYNETVCGSYSRTSFVRVVKLRRLLVMGKTCRERRNATECWWENLLEYANLDKGEGDGNRPVRGILE